MSLAKMPATTQKSKKRSGRGYGSGKGGHTTGSGQKGQKTRSKLPLYFEGTAMRKSLIRRMPMFRGKLRFKPSLHKPLILNLTHLETLPKDTVVTVESLIKNKILSSKVKNCPVKILGDGQLTKALTVTLPVSKSALKKIESAGGKVVSQEKIIAKPKVLTKKKVVAKK